MTVQTFVDWLQAMEKNTELGGCACSEWGPLSKVKIWLEAAWLAGASSKGEYSDRLRDALDAVVGKGNWSLYRAANGEWELRVEPNAPFDFAPLEDKPFGEWPDDAKMAAFKSARIDGVEWEFWSSLDERWIPALPTAFADPYGYRPKPIEEEPQFSLPDHVWQTFSGVHRFEKDYAGDVRAWRGETVFCTLDDHNAPEVVRLFSEVPAGTVVERPKDSDQ